MVASSALVLLLAPHVVAFTTQSSDSPRVLQVPHHDLSALVHQEEVHPEVSTAARSRSRSHCRWSGGSRGAGVYISWHRAKLWLPCASALLMLTDALALTGRGVVGAQSRVCPND